MFGALSAMSPDKFGPSAYFAIRDLGEVCEHMMLPRTAFWQRNRNKTVRFRRFRRVALYGVSAFVRKIYSKIFQPFSGPGTGSCNELPRAESCDGRPVDRDVELHSRHQAPQIKHSHQFCKEFFLHQIKVLTFNPFTRIPMIFAELTKRYNRRSVIEELYCHEQVQIFYIYCSFLVCFK